MVQRKISIDQPNICVRHRKQTRRPYLPLELRLQLYDEVLRLRKQGLSHNEIIERIRKNNEVQLYKSHISYWVRGIHTPYGSINRFDAVPSPQLASVIGVMMSDGNQHLQRGQWDYRLWLGVKDKDFAEGFGRNLAELLGQRKPYKAWWNPRGYWVVQGRSHLLYRFLQQPLEKLKPYIEHSEDCAAAFLRAFFDGEGNIHGRQLTAYNTDRQLLIYVKELLKRHFDIDTTGPRITMKKGTIMHCPRTKKPYRANKNCYSIYIRAHSLRRFHKHIGFTINRKQQRLAAAAEK